MISPPRSAELLLETLGAAPALRDAVVGDLAEEFAWISDAVDERTARRWYRREAIRAIPLLLRSSLRSTTWRDVRRRVGIALCAGVLALLLSSIMSALLVIVFRIFGGSQDGLIIFVTFNLVLGTATALTAGYIAARLDDRTPLVSAMSLALPWSGAHVVQSMIYDLPLALTLVEAVVFVGLAALGGGLRLRQRAANEIRIGSTT